LFSYFFFFFFFCFYTFPETSDDRCIRAAAGARTATNIENAMMTETRLNPESSLTI